MKNLSSSINLFFTIAIFLIFSTCTHNPFDSTKISVPGRTIIGKVELNDRASPEGVYVWLENFDLGTFTNRKGKFSIMLPPPNVQSIVGVTGAFRLFFHLANYKLDSAWVVVRKGELEYSGGDFNDDGNLSEPKYLIKCLNIETDVQPASVATDYIGPINLEVTLQATNDSVTVKFPKCTQGPASIILIKQLEPVEKFVKVLDTNGQAFQVQQDTQSVSIVPTHWMANFRFDPNVLPKGKYEIVPYFLIEQGAIPQDLLNNLGSNVYKPGPDFLNLPIKRKGGKFTVTGPVK